MKRSPLSRLMAAVLAAALLSGCLAAPTPTSTPTQIPVTPSPAATSTPPATLTPAPTPTPTGAAMKEWKLVWSDEFDGPAGAQPDLQKWRYDLGGQGWGNQEWETYTNRAENASLDGSGALVIRAIQQPDPAASGLNCWYGPCKFTSARLLTKGLYEFQYGRVEARLQIPYGQGIWPAFWMLGSNIDAVSWPQSGEIDIMENIGKEANTVHGTLHGPGYAGEHGIGHGTDLPEALSAGYHVFAVEWEAQSVRWYVDGKQYFEVTPDMLPAGKAWVFDHPFFILLNLAVGGLWPGYPDQSTVFPQEYRIDYVRIYN